MGLIPEHQINEIKDRVDIVDIIGDYVQLNRAGSNFKGLCPFHNEKTPSFIVSRDKNNFHCFGCHEGGDAISFLMKMENLSYIETIRFLADKLGIVLEETQTDRAKIELYNKYYEINSVSAKYYFKNLLTSEIPQRYMELRGLQKKILNNYFLGYAKNDNGLLNYLKSKGYSEKDMLTLGLIGEKNGRYYDKFRDRLIFPILNNKNKVIGFGGRVLGEGNPKYLNSPESPIFIKGKNLYGVNVINKKRKKDRVILVEGYMDVISLYNYGIDYALASLGTALTEDQARMVKRYSTNIFIAYDGDEAGTKAALKAIEIFKNMGVQLGVVHFPDNLDPDEYIKKFGVESFEKMLDKAKEPIDFKLETIGNKHLSKVDFTKEIIDYLVDIQGNVIRDLYIDKAANYIGVSTEALRRDVEIKMQEIDQRNQNKRSINNFQRSGYKSSRENLKPQNTRMVVEKEIIVTSILNEEFYNYLKKYKQFIKSEDLRNIYSDVEKVYENNMAKDELLNNQVVISYGLLRDYEMILKRGFSPSIIKELEERINRINLEDRRDFLLAQIKEKKADQKVVDEYTEILRRLT